MPAAVDTLIEIPHSADQRVLLQVDWDGYEAMLTIRGDVPVPRMYYLEGVLELMSPSHRHEWLKSFISRLVEAYADERELDLIGVGSWTLRRAGAGRGAEPDICYQLGEKGDEHPPDLAIEVALTSGGVDKLEIYRGLAVPEVWIWRRGRIQVFVLGDDGYSERPISVLLPGLDLRALEESLGANNQARSVRTYRESLRTR